MNQEPDSKHVIFSTMMLARRLVEMTPLLGLASYCGFYALHRHHHRHRHRHRHHQQSSLEEDPRTTTASRSNSRAFIIRLLRISRNVWDDANHHRPMTPLLLTMMLLVNNSHNQIISSNNSNSRQERPIGSSLLLVASFLLLLGSTTVFLEKDDDDDNDPKPTGATTTKNHSLTMGGKQASPTTLPPSSTCNSARNNTTMKSRTPSSTPPGERYLEILVHNVSHTDMVLSLFDEASKEEYLCRPRFSTFDKYSTNLCIAVTTCISSTTITKDEQPALSLLSFPRYERLPDGRLAKEDSSMEEIPIGFTWKNRHHVEETLLKATPSELRIRGRDIDHSRLDTTCHIQAVFFPLLGTLLPQWQHNMKARHGGNKKQVLVLVTGVGMPRNWTHSRTGNSTEDCAKLMKEWIHQTYPELIVLLVHSSHDSSLFRYDHNSDFVQRQLLPTIHSYRDAHATGAPYPDEQQQQGTVIVAHTNPVHPFSSEWNKSMHVSLSFADGSPARTHAIQAALRPYRPTTFHVWQLKTFWHDTKIVDSDVEVHSFEEMETLPPRATSELSTDDDDDPMIYQVVQEMKAFRQEMEDILSSSPDSHDLDRFWLRKTHKPVLAVLAVLSDGNVTKWYRGTNMEVSMPTGSLCAERNVIGTALADNPRLKREDLKLIAVLSVLPTRSRGEDLNPLKPCGACNEWLKKIAESNPYFQIVTFTDADCSGVYCTPCEE